MNMYYFYLSSDMNALEALFCFGYKIDYEFPKTITHIE